MNDLLFKLGFADKFTIELPTTRDHFVKTLQQNVDSASRYDFDIFEPFKSSKNHYKGEVTLNSFHLKKRRTFGSSSIGLGTAEGTFRQRDEKLIIDVSISGISKSILIIVIVFFAIVYGVGFTSLAIGIANGLLSTPLFFVFMLAHAAVMVGIPYFVIRGGVKSFKYNLERDLYFMIK